MSDEDNKLYRTFGGRNKAIAVIVAFIVALAFFIAGAVMLGVGINKANTKSTCDNGNVNTYGPSGTSTPGPIVTKPPPEKVTAKPFYLTVLNNRVTGDQVEKDFNGSVQAFNDVVTAQLRSLGGSPSITILSISSSKSFNTFIQEDADNSPAVGLVAVVYTNEAKIGEADIKNAIESDATLEVPNIEAGGKPLEDRNKQLCKTVNPTVVVSQTTTRFTGTTTKFTGTTTKFTGTTNVPASTKTPGSTKQGTTTTEAPASDYKPCKKRIVVAIDNANSNAYVRPVKNFLIKQVFAGNSSNWNHVERLGLLWYATKTEHTFPFNYFSDKGKDLDFVRRYISASSPLPKTTSSLSTALDDLNTKFNTSDSFGEVRFLVFVSDISQTIVDSVKASAALLQAKGGLAMIGLGNIDPDDKFFKQLTDKYRRWEDPVGKPILTRWENFFWEQVYGCGGSPPSDAPTGGTELPITFPPIPTTAAPVPLPCDGRIAIFLDRSSSLGVGPFNNQRTFVGQKLFSNDIFNKYSRLSINSYDKQGTSPNDFGTVSSYNDAKAQVEDITKLSSDDSNLRKALVSVADYDFSTTIGAQITVIFFVSNLPDDQVDDARKAAQDIQGQGIRLYLIAHGSVSQDKMTQVTGDASMTYKWLVTASEIPDYKNWFKTVLGCPSTSNIFNEFGPEENDLAVPNDRFDYSTYPCSGRIIVAFDNSNQLTPDNYQRQIDFLDFKIFTSRWTDLDRLAIVSYNSFPNSQTYGTFESADDIHEFIDDDVQTSSKPSLNRALAIFINDKLVDASKPSHAVFFVSFIDEKTRDDCQANAKAIAQAGCRITFVAMGNSVDTELLKDLSAYVITWDIDSQPEPDNWEQQFWTAYGCQGPIPTLAPSGTTKSPAPVTKAPRTKPPVTTAKPVPYVPCGNSEGTEVAVFFENSKNLDPGEYQTILDFLGYKTFNYWSHFERLVLGYYSKYSSQTEPGFFLGQSDIIDYLKDIPKTNLVPNIRRFFTSLPTNPISPIENFPQFYIIFVSSINQDAADVIKPIIQTLGAAKITFVALKNADQSILKSLVPDVIDWSDLTQPEPVDWENKFWAAYGCDSKPPTVPPPRTEAPKHSTPKPSTLAPTSPRKPTRPPSTPAPTPVPYKPCKREITFMFDASNDISADIFPNLKHFIGTTVMSGLNYIDRIGLGYYKKLGSSQSPGTCLDQACVDEYLSSIDQSTFKPIVRRAFQHLAEDDIGITGFPRTFVVFVGALSDDDVTNSIDYANKIRTFAYLSVIGVQSSVTKANMDKLANFSYNLDVSNLPDNIQDILSQAYGCTA